MAAWDPFLDPADGPQDLKVELDPDPLEASVLDVPLDPWNDSTFVALAQEAAREAEERYEAAMKVLEVQQEAERKETEAKEARRLKLEKEAREIAKLSIQELKECRTGGSAYAEMAMEAIGQAPAIAAILRKSKGRDLDEPEDLALGRAAAQIAAADMGASRPVALLFPDQNSKSLKMLKGLQELPEARRLREASRQLLGFDPLEGPGVLGFYELLRGPEGWLEHTQFCQPVMYLTQLAAVEKLRDKRPGALERCKAVAGLSLGDYAALTYAGVWDFETGLRAVQLRAEVMEAAIAAVPQAALAVAGLPEELLQQLCEQCREGSSEDSVCGIAQRLFPQGFVCSGSLAAMERLLERARRSQGCKQVLKAAAAGPLVKVPGEVARSSCALARHDCSRKGRRPLRAGGLLLPKILDARIHLCDGCRRSSQRTVLEDIESLFEAAVLNSSLELRPHLATLLEYSKRARSVLQVGSSDTAWIAILQGGLQRSDGQLYQTELTANLMDFLQQHDLRSLGIRVVEGYQASEMLFFSRRIDFESLAAKSAMAKFILLHGTKYSGEHDDGDSHQGTVFFEELQQWLNNNRAWQLAEYSSLGAGLAILIRSQRTSNCSDAWAPAQSLASELLEVRHGYPSLLGSTWHVRSAAVTAMHRRLAAIQSRCPDAKAALQVLQLFSSKDPQMLQGLMESSAAKKYKETIPKPRTLGTLEALNPELSLLLLHRGQLPDEDRHRLLDVSVAQWPHRSEFWQILADDLVYQRGLVERDVTAPLAMQAIRRCFSLAHFDRSVVFRLLEMLEVLRRPREATLLWDAVAGSPTAPWDDQRRSAASVVSVPQVFAENAAVFPGEAFLNKHPEFKFARDYMEAFSDDLLTEQLNIIRTWSFAAALVQLGLL
eukprot:s118_g27.t2